MKPNINRIIWSLPILLIILSSFALAVQYNNGTWFSAGTSGTVLNFTTGVEIFSVAWDATWINVTGMEMNVTLINIDDGTIDYLADGSNITFSLNDGDTHEVREPETFNISNTNTEYTNLTYELRTETYKLNLNGTVMFAIIANASLIWNATTYLALGDSSNNSFSVNLDMPATAVEQNLSLTWAIYLVNGTLYYTPMEYLTLLPINMELMFGSNITGVYGFESNPYITYNFTVNSTTNITTGGYEFWGDNFTRADNNNVGNGWSELEANAGHNKILNNQLYQTKALGGTAPYTYRSAISNITNVTFTVKNVDASEHVSFWIMNTAMTTGSVGFYIVNDKAYCGDGTEIGVPLDNTAYTVVIANISNATRRYNISFMGVGYGCNITGDHFQMVRFKQEDNAPTSCYWDNFRMDKKEETTVTTTVFNEDQLSLHLTEVPLGRINVKFNSNQQFYEFYNDQWTPITENMTVINPNVNLSVVVKDPADQYIEGVGVNLYQIRYNNESLLVGRRITDGNGQAFFKVNSEDLYVLEVNESEYSYFLSREIDPSWHWFGLVSNEEEIILTPKFWEQRKLNLTSIQVWPGTKLGDLSTQIAIITENPTATTISYKLNGTTLQSERDTRSAYLFRPSSLGIGGNFSINVLIDGVNITMVNFTYNANWSMPGIVDPDALAENERELTAIFLFIGLIILSAVVGFATEPDGKGAETFSIGLLLLSPFWTWFAVAGFLSILKVIIDAWKVFTE